ncbi:transposase, IS605 OrfB family [Stanieria cyanosphaera PCC 7437]|uniref:Transposase, IS605 OrfB family n=1 Tax=Stanieria cyanosphaera (strain ATCC 29371 / PCC 7437) TaxID=111780 RepID=K9Y0N1_STAC7|nr:RNA-guided endonuclease TnpB family protein [Stanieria cyanosphaera]AFZ37946.1 transposase, IS605 OrfB family [Stanieria cyanosphaera PCC 7437]
MLVYEFKVKANKHQCQAINEAIRISQFIRNKCLRLWLDSSKEDKINCFALNKLTKVLADNKAEFPFVANLNSMARQASAERAWFAISRFYDNCKKKITGKKGFPKFKKNSRSVEYKTSGWKLSQDRKYLTITDKTGIGGLKLIGTYDLHYYQIEQIKRIRLIKRADGYYAQFCIDQKRLEDCTPTHNALGLDVGLESFYTDSNGDKVENPRFLRKAEKKLKRLQRSLSRKRGGSNNRSKARQKLARQHLKVSRQRKDFAVKLARCVMISNDIVVIENLNIKGLARTRMAKSVTDASWSLFRQWLEYFAKVFQRKLVAVNPNYTSQDCSSCGERVKKSLSTRTHICECGIVLCRDHNAAINILNKGLDAVGRTESLNDSGQINLCLVSESLLDKLAG